MDKTINIRRVKIDDANTLALIQTESWKSAFKEILSKEDLEKYTDINSAINLYNKLLKENIANGFILTINEIPHCMAYWDKSRDEEMKGYAEIICIHSLCNNWRKGYGTEMMNYILKDIKNSGFNKVMLTEKTQKFSDYIEVMYYKIL